MTTGPGDEKAAGGSDRGHFRASHADREQVIAALRAAFIQGRLTRDEFDLRVGRALEARTYAELAALTVEDLTWTDDGLVILIRRSKGDQVAAGEEVGILPQKDPTVCPIALLKEWLEKSETKTGTIFRRMDRNDCIGNRPMTGPSITRLVKEWVEAAGFDATDYGAHSLRAGFATTAAKKGANLPQIMRHGRWKDQRVAMSYIRPATTLDDNPTEGLGDDPEDE